MISAIVATGELSDPDAARYLTDVIIRRRDKVVAYWIGQTNPLDRFAVRQTVTGPELTFDNAAVRLDLAKQETSFRAAWLAHDNTACVGRPVGEEITLGSARLPIPDRAWGPADATGFRYATASIKTIHSRNPHWANPVVVTVRDRAGAIDIVGIERPTRPGL
jgi:hypothetical protein